MEKEIAIVYLVAGLSTRFGGDVKSFAKIGRDGESLIEYSLNQAIKAGFSKICFIVGNTTEKPFKEKFGDEYKGISVLYAVQGYDTLQRDRPMGTAEALSKLRGIIDCKFVICNGDNIYGEDTFKILSKHLNDSEEEATVGYRLGDTLNENPANRGMFSVKDGYVCDLKEMIGLQKARLPEGISIEDSCSKNIFALHPRIIELMNDKAQKFKKEHENDRKIEYILSTALCELLEENKMKMKIYPAVCECYDVTMKEDVERVREKIRGREKLTKPI